MLAEAAELSAEGYRVLAIAGRASDDGELSHVLESEQDLVLYGLAPWPTRRGPSPGPPSRPAARPASCR